MAVSEGGNYQEQLDKLFEKSFLSMPDNFLRDNWRFLSEIGHNATDFEVNKVAKGKKTVMFIPTPTKKNIYSTFEQINGISFKLIEGILFASELISIDEIKKLLGANLYFDQRDIIILCPNQSSEKVDVYVIKKVKSKTKEVIQGAVSDIEDILNPKSVDNPIIK